MITSIILVSTLILGIGIDIYLALNKKDGDTWSEKIREWSSDRFPIVSFFLGSLGGHFFSFVDYRVNFFVSLIAFIVFCIAIQVFRMFYTYPKWTMIVFFQIGVIFGFFLFPL